MPVPCVLWISLQGRSVWKSDIRVIWQVQKKKNTHTHTHTQGGFGFGGSFSRIANFKSFLSHTAVYKYHTWGLTKGTLQSDKYDSRLWRLTPGRWLRGDIWHHLYHAWQDSFVLIPQKKEFLLHIKRCIASVHVAQKNNESQGGKEWASIYSLIQKTLSPPLASYYPIASSPLILLTCHISVLVCGAWGVCTCICKCVCVVFLRTCDTQPSITSLESFRSRCAPIHTHSQCFDFPKSKDVNHLPPLVRAGECTHTGVHACMPARARPHRACTHTRMSYPSTSSSHSPPSLSRSPSSLPLSHSTIWE